MRALHDVCVSIDSGSFTVLVGPSGSGKTTLLALLGALDRPTCPQPPAETPPPAPFAGATWISGRYDWNGLAWAWSSGHYEHPPEVGSVWVPPAHIAVSGTLVVRPGRWVRLTLGAPNR